MKKICLLVFAFLVFSLSFSDNLEDLQKKWDYENPFSLPHWLTSEEMSRFDEIGKDFYVTEPPPAPVKNVAEFDKMQAVLIRYPFGIPMSLIAEMSQDITVLTIVANENQQNTVLNQYSGNGVDINNCDFLIAPTDSYWTRDYGPWFIFDGNDEPGIVNFPYNRPRPNDNDIPIEVAEYFDINLYGMNLIHTGGNYMTDGMGNSASSTLVWEENPSLTHAEVSQYVHDFLGIENYHVIPDPNNTYIDHIDCWGKFLAPNKVLIRSVPESHPQYDEIENTASYFANQLCAYGTNYEVYRVYTPNDEPYTNSLILNNKVFVPQTGSAWDDDALETYQEAMPGYEIHGVYSSDWLSTDALHCRTKGIADLGMLYISHLPLLGAQPAGSDYEINAEIKAYSGEPVYSDSLWVYYEINGGNYNAVQMSLVGENSYRAIIPAQPEGTEIKYYIHAADQSGRSANCPFIGASDPFVFYSAFLPQLSVNPTEINLELPEDSIVTEILQLSNIGGGTINYSILLDFFPDRDISGSYIQCSAENFIPGETSTWTFTVYNASSDNEWLRSVSIDFPEGVIVNSSTNFSGGSGGDLVSNGMTGNGVEISWNDNDGGWGNIYPDEYATAEVNVSVSPVFDTDIVLNYQIAGDEYGSAPHQIEGTVSIALAGEPISWISLNQTSGSLSTGETDNIEITFDTNDLETGTYNCNIVVNDDRNETIIPVSLTVTGVETSDDNVSQNTFLASISPNPFIITSNQKRSNVKIDFQTSLNSVVDISVYNVRGEKIKTLLNSEIPSGSHRVIWDGRDSKGNYVASGIYFYRMKTDNYSQTKKMMIIK